MSRILQLDYPIPEKIDFGLDVPYNIPCDQIKQTLLQDYEFWQKSKEEQEAIHQTMPGAGRESLSHMHFFILWITMIKEKMAKQSAKYQTQSAKAEKQDEYKIPSEKDWLIINKFYNIQSRKLYMANDYNTFFLILNNSIIKSLTKEVIISNISINIPRNYTGCYITVYQSLRVGYIENGAEQWSLDHPIWLSAYIRTLFVPRIETIKNFIRDIQIGTILSGKQKHLLNLFLNELSVIISINNIK